MGDSKSLKEANLTWLSVYMLAHAVAILWIALDRPVDAEHFKQLSTFKWLKGCLFAFSTLGIVILNRLGSTHIKAVLVFWRFSHPLPASRAFSKLALQDERINIAKLRSIVGGDFPSDPKAQNTTWYKLYQANIANASILSTHKEYLLFRDMTWLTSLLFLPAVILWLGQFANVPGIRHYVGVCLVSYVCCSWLARSSGKRFVRTVMAVSSASVDTPQLVIPTR